MDLPLHPDARLLAHHPTGLIAVEKPPGVRTHPNQEKPDRRALLALPYDTETEAYRLENGDPVYLLHRLDAPTSGVVLLATAPETAEAARGAFAAHAVEKTYYALVKGRPARPAETWHDRLWTRRDRGAVRTKTGHGDPAETRMERLRSFSGPPVLSVLRLIPVTGRTHQLRVQCAARGLCIVGDATYGDFRFNRLHAKQTGQKRLFLHAAEIRLTGDGRNLPDFRVEAPVPAEFPRF